MAHRISRRTFGAGLALGLPLAALSRFSSAQTPASGLVAVGPHELRDTLINRPFEVTYRGYEFETTRWSDVSDTPYYTAVGGINVQVRVVDGYLVPHLGAYVVYLDDRGPQSAMFHARNHYADRTVKITDQAVEGHKGEVIVYQDNREHNVTLVPMGNVLTIGYDVLAPLPEREGEYGSAEPAAVLVRHLEEILDTPT